MTVLTTVNYDCGPLIAALDRLTIQISQVSPASIERVVRRFDCLPNILCAEWDRNQARAGEVCIRLLPSEGLLQFIDSIATMQFTAVSESSGMDAVHEAVMDCFDSFDVLLTLEEIAARTNLKLYRVCLSVQDLLDARHLQARGTRECRATGRTQKLIGLPWRQ